MKNHLKKVLIVSIIVISLAGMLIYSTFNFIDYLKSNAKKDGFDVFLTNTDIFSLSIKGNTLWAGGSNGLFKINMTDFSSEKVGNYKFVRVVLTDNSGVWVGHDDGLTHIGKSTKTYTQKDGLPDNRVNSVMIDKKNNVWCGTWGGVSIIQDKIIKTYTQQDGLLVNMVNAIMEDNKGGIWFGSYVAPRGGISILHNNKWQYFTTDNALLHSNISSIIQLKDNSVLVGGGLYTKGGGTRFVNISEKWVKDITLTKEKGLIGEKIRSLYEDNNNLLWVGSEYDGLTIMKNFKMIKYLNEKTGLSNDEVKAIIEDKNNNYWIGTRNGLTKISKKFS